jgi:hypothetical protein
VVLAIRPVAVVAPGDELADVAEGEPPEFDEDALRRLPSLEATRGGAPTPLL